jgi:hypothetical protein
MPTPHPYFDLLLHSDEELSSLLEEQVTARETLHEWPLSCVQRLHLAGGKTLIYKSQCGPTVEAEFYATAGCAAVHSPILPQARTLYRDPCYACLLLEDLPGVPLEQLGVDEKTALSISNTLLGQIAGIQGDPPVYMDISTWERWQEQMNKTLETLSGLVARGEFTRTSSADIANLTRAAQSQPVRAAYAQVPAGLVHHDHSAENILAQDAASIALAEPGAFKVIDWQRPLRAPVEIDHAVLLESLGVDPRPHVHPGILILIQLLRAYWFIACAQTWFPPGCAAYDQAISEIVAALPREIR